MPESRSRRASSLAFASSSSRGDFVLLGGHERAEAVELRLIALGLGFAHLLGRSVAVGECGLCGLDAGAAGLVEGEDVGRHGREPPAGEGGVEGLRGLTDGADVVHGLRVFCWSGFELSLWRSFGRYGRGGGRGCGQRVGTGEVGPGHHVGDERAVGLAEDLGDRDALHPPVAGAARQKRRAGKARDDGAVADDQVGLDGGDGAMGVAVERLTRRVEVAVERCGLGLRRGG
jgi:hypothetical protein